MFPWKTWAIAAAVMFAALWIVLTQRENTQLKAQIHAMTEAAQQAEIKALERQRETEREWQQKAAAAAAAAAQDVADVEAGYEQSLQSLYDLLAERDDRAVSDLHGVAAGGVQSDGAGGDAAALPEPAAVAGSTCPPCPGGRSGADTKRVKRLSERVMTVARDCDITAARYNELLRLWGQVATE